ncbi:MAG: hypothetical protein WBV82_20685 [Myxococcaceae bacterium]
MRPLVRGGFLGLIAALFVSGLALMFVGARSIVTGPDCSGITPTECSFERDILMAFARRQVLVGGALSLLGLALWMLFKRRSA